LGCCFSTKETVWNIRWTTVLFLSQGEAEIYLAARPQRLREERLTVG
jgi:hypothetical protein